MPRPDDVGLRDDLVWYVSYGSNLSRERFLTYLTGGRPSGRTERQSGARDPSPPRADRAIVIAHRLYFAGDTAVWGGGGVAYVDPDPDASVRTLARAWLITDEQFIDVWEQEGERYARRLDLAPIDRLPAVTFTTPVDLADQVAPPSDAYAATLVAGLVESHRLDESDAAAYVAAAAL